MRSLSGQTVVYLFSSVFSVLIGYGFKIYLARTLGAGMLGVYALGMTLVDLAGMIVSFGIPLTLTRYIPAFRAKGMNDRLSGLIGTSTLIALVSAVVMMAAMMAFPGPLTAPFKGREMLAPVLFIFAAFVPINALTNVAGSVLRGFHDAARRVVISTFVQNPVKIVMTVILVWMSYGLRGYLTAELLGALATLVLLWMTFGKLMKKSGLTAKPTLQLPEREVVFYAGNIMVMNYLYFANSKLDQLILGMFLDLDKLGIYSVAITTASFMPIIMSSFNSIFAPMVSQLRAGGEHDALQNVIYTSTKLVLGLTLPLVAGVILCAPEFMAVFGADFQKEWQVLAILGIGQLVNVATGSVGTIMLMSGMQKTETLNVVVTGALSVFLNVMLIPWVGLLGAAAASAITVSLANFLRMYQVRRKLGLRMYNRSAIRLAGPIAMTLAVVTVISAVLRARGAIHWVVLVSGLCCGYTVMLFLGYFHGLLHEERTMLNRIVAGAIPAIAPGE
jgi:O-antigen/teichoic acid export membrane protein